MLLPNLKSARVRTSNKVNIIRDEFKLTDELSTIGLNKKYFVKTYGCQMNEHDSENITAILELMGYTSCDNYLDADLIILNTCAIRENVHNKVFGMIGRVKNLKESSKDVILGICGCMAQEEVVVNEIITKYPHVDFVFGTHNIHDFPNILNKTIKSKKLEVCVLSIEGDVIENIPVKRDNKYKAWVNVMYGCDKFCTYCIVPYTRGKQRSRLIEDIYNEILELSNNGYQEVTLLGQNVNAYGKDLGDNSSLATLLDRVSKININRVRFMTSHPWDFTDELIEVIKNNKNIMPYIHLPIQSGSNNVLKVMGRRYTKEEYKILYDKLRSALPNSCITTDIIVGYPTESDEDFQDTLDIVNYCKFDSAFTFIFSARVGTPAYSMEDNTSKEVKHARLATLNSIVNEHALNRNLSYIGKTIPVLIEGISLKDSNLLVGYSDTMKLVNVEGDSSLIGQICNVAITDAKTFSMDGKVVENS